VHWHKQAIETVRRNILYTLVSNNCKLRNINTTTLCMGFQNPVSLAHSVSQVYS
jgi:hypothetical protein